VGSGWDECEGGLKARLQLVCPRPVLRDFDLPFALAADEAHGGVQQAVAQCTVRAGFPAHGSSKPRGRAGCQKRRFAHSEVASPRAVSVYEAVCGVVRRAILCSNCRAADRLAQSDEPLLPFSWGSAVVDLRVAEGRRRPDSVRSATAGVAAGTSPAVVSYVCAGSPSTRSGWDRRGMVCP